jgi:hypothetical protein
MAIRIERSGLRTVAVQRRLPVRLAAWGLVVAVVAAVVVTLVGPSEAEEARARDHTRVRCQRLDDQCDVRRGDKSWMMRLETMSAVKVETDGAGDDARVIAVITRAHGLPTHHLCEARPSDPEAAGIRAAADQLGRFLSDRRVESVDVSCDTRRAGAAGASTQLGRMAAQVGGMLLMLGVLLLFLVEIRTEIDGEAGVVRVRGRSALPPRRWSVERPTGEVVAVDSDTRGWGGMRSFTVYLKFVDGSTAVVLTPATGWRQKVGNWQADLARTLGVPAPPRGS